VARISADQPRLLYSSDRLRGRLDSTPGSACACGKFSSDEDIADSENGAGTIPGEMNVKRSRPGDDFLASPSQTSIAPDSVEYSITRSSLPQIDYLEGAPADSPSISLMN
jgi:hypothetical protein